MLSVFLSSKCSLFHNSNLFGSCIIDILYTGVLNLKKNNSGAKRPSDALNCWQNTASVIDERMNVRRWQDDADKGKLRYSQKTEVLAQKKKTFPGAAVSATNLTCTGLVSNTSSAGTGRQLTAWAVHCVVTFTTWNIQVQQLMIHSRSSKVIVSQEMALTKLPCYNHAVLGIGLNLSSFCVDAWSLPWKIPRRSQ